MGFQSGFCVNVGFPCALTFKLLNHFMNSLLLHEYFLLKFCRSIESIPLFPMNSKSRLGRYWLFLPLLWNVVYILAVYWAFLRQLLIDFHETTFAELISDSLTFRIISGT